VRGTPAKAQDAWAGRGSADDTFSVAKTLKRDSFVASMSHGVAVRNCKSLKQHGNNLQHDAAKG
jgi:hypothetical protein